MASSFVPSQYVRLHNLLSRAVASPSSSAADTASNQGTSNDWYIAVDGLRNELVDLGKVRPMDDAEKREIEGGKITVGGSTHPLNADFSSLTLAIASNLSISPRFCASLLQAALSSRSRFPSRSLVEIALILYHRERWALTESWKQIVQGAITLPQEEGAAKQKMGLKLSQALQALLALKVTDTKAKREVSLPVRILSEIDYLKEQATSVENSLRNPPSNPSQRLPDEVQLDRLAAIRQERRAWGHILYLLCISAMLQGSEILAIAQWLSRVQEDQQSDQKELMMPYILAALLSGLETSTQASLQGSTGPGYPDLLQDRAALGHLNTLINATTWSIPSLQAVVQLQWSLHLVQVVQADPSVGGELHVSEESVSQAVLKAVQKGDALVYTVVRLLGWKQQLQDALEGTEEEDNLQRPSGTPSGFGAGNEEEVDSEFQQYLLASLHSLYLSICTTFLSLLRKMQRQEEDAAYNTSRSAGKTQRRFDLEALFDGIALVAKGDTQKALQFWLAPDGRRSRFLLWAVELREEGHQRALLDLLNALASGGDGAWQAHTLLSSNQEDSTDEGLVSWNRLWEWLGYYVDALRKPSVNSNAQASIPPSEASLLRSFLGLLRSVVASSLAAREALLAITLTSTNAAPQQNPNPFGLPSTSSQSGTGTTVLRRLFAMYTCPIPTELKATILDVLSAFAKDAPQGSGSSGRAGQVRQELWALLEGSGVLNSNKSSPNARSSRIGFGSTLGLRPPQTVPQSGVLFELNNVEAPSGLYPGTTSFINFLASLIVPDAGLSSGRTSGDINALVADLPSTSSSGQLVQQQNAQPLGVPAPAGTATASTHPTDIGLEKYITFVTESVFLPTVAKSNAREFVSIGEKWRVIAACLAFYDRCLAAYDLTSLERPLGATGRRGADDKETLLRLAMHPGFGVLKRFMGPGKLLHEVLQVLVPHLEEHGQVGGSSAGFEAVDSSAAKKHLFVPVAVRSALRLVLRTLKAQDLYLQVLLPTLAGLAEVENASKMQSSMALPAGLDLEARIGQNSNYTPIDAKLLQEYESVVQIALFVNSNRDDLALLGVQLLAKIADSSAFSEVDRFADGVGGIGRRRLNRLAGLLEMTDESSRVREGVVRRLDALSDSEGTSNGAPLAPWREEEDEGDDFMQGTAAVTFEGNEAVCQAVLELLLSNVQNSKAAPNIAHMLLGFDLRAVKAEEQVITQPSADSPRGVLHSLLDLFRGAKSFNGDDNQDTAEEGLSLLSTHPSLAEKALALLVRLSTHPFTSPSILRYLRTQENFWASEMQDNFSAYVEPVEREIVEEGSLELQSFTKLSHGSIVFPDGRSSNTSVDALVASLQSRTHLLEGFSIELHGLVASGMVVQAARLTASLFGSGAVIPMAGLSGETQSDDRDFILTGKSSAPASSGAESSIRLLDMLRSFDFEWHDERDGVASSLNILGALDIQQARASSEDSGTKEFDISKAIALLAFARRELERLGELNELRKRAAFDQEAACVLQYVSCRNAHRVIAANRRRALISWRNLHDLVLSHSSILFRPEARAGVVFDCLGALLPRLEGPLPDEDPMLGDLAAGAILALLTSLRRHRSALEAASRLTGSVDSVDDLPIDRLLVTLRALTGALLRTSISVSARGHLYSALINYLQLARVASLPDESRQQQRQSLLLGGDDSSSQIGLNDFNDGASGIFSLSGTSAAGNETQPASLLEQRTRSFLASHAERLIPVIARDALDAPDVWRTVAFTLLDKLVALEGLTRNRAQGSRPLLVDILLRGGFMKSFVSLLRDMDLDLQEALRPDPSSLNALYVYEAELAFFGRLAQSSAGADSLLESRLLEVFAQADFLAARPEQDQDFVDLESFLPAATERFGALLRPALQVTVSIVNAAASHRPRAAIIGHGGYQSSESHSAHTSLQQALALLNAHRDTFLAVLRSAVQDTTSISTVEQAQLVTALLLQILPILDDDALSPPKPLAALHSAVLALAAGFLHSTAWKPRIVPFTDTERELEAAEAPTYKTRSREDGEDMEGDYKSQFDVAAALAVSHLNTTVLSYLEAGSETFGHTNGHRGVRPCLTSTLAVPQPFSANQGFNAHDDLAASRRSVGPGSSARLASVASLGIALASLDEEVAQFEADLYQSEHIKGMLESNENVRLEEWDSIAHQAVTSTPAIASLGDLGLGQRRSIAIQSLKGRLASIKARSTERLDAIDIALVLIHRHFAYYLSLASDAPSSQIPNVDQFAAPWRSTSAASKRGGSGLNNQSNNIDARSLINDGSQMVQMVLERLGRVLITINENGNPSGLSNPRERSAFLELVGRKLQTLLMVREDKE
ncbi:unnamed protein product [Sympodiomycopsis kandeliae]